MSDDDIATFSYDANVAYVVRQQQLGFQCNGLSAVCAEDLKRVTVTKELQNFASTNFHRGSLRKLGPLSYNP